MGWAWCATLALAIAMSGCASPPGASPAEAHLTAPSQGAPPVPIASVPPPACASESTVAVDENATFAGSAHSHDLWGGADRILAFEGDVEPRYGGVSLPGFYVVPGTGRVEFTLNWTPVLAAVPENRTLEIEYPGDGRHYDDPLLLVFERSGATNTVAIGPKSTDRPHASRSSWSVNLDEAAHARIVLHRGDYCLPVDPPHLDHWGGATQKTLLDATQQIRMNNLCVQDSCVVSSGDYYGLMPKAGDIVPPGTGTITARMRWTTDSPTPVRFVLDYVGAGQDVWAYEWARAEQPTSESANERVFILPVVASMCDEPYESELSQWRFRAMVDNGDLRSTIGDTAYFSGTMEWLILAHRA